MYGVLIVQLGWNLLVVSKGNEFAEEWHLCLCRTITLEYQWILQMPGWLLLPE